jgi:hypothetical protein
LWLLWLLWKDWQITAANLLWLPGSAALQIGEDGAWILYLIVGIVDVLQNGQHNVGGGMTETAHNEHAYGGYATNTDSVFDHALSSSTPSSHLVLLCVVLKRFSSLVLFENLDQLRIR